MSDEPQTARGWTQLACPNCRGHGLLSSYSFDGSDFLGADECRDCNGSGYIWRSPKGALASYPGAKFIGREPKMAKA